MPLASVSASPRRRLIAANFMLVALLSVHTLDHVLRQETAVPAEAAVAGTVGLGAALAALGLSLAGSRPAAPVTALVGLATAAGFVAVHVLPDWSAFSQPYADIPVDALSWAGMIVTALAAAGVGAVGWRAASTG